MRPVLRLAMGLLWLALALLPLPSRAGAPEEIAAQTAAVETALADKRDTDAQALAQSALMLAETSLGADSLEAANLHRLLGDALFNQEKFADAEPHYRRALAIRESTLGTDTADTAVSANDLAIVLKRQGRSAEAEPYYRQVVAIREKVLGPNDRATARSTFFLARIIETNGDGASAAQTMGLAVERAAIAYGPADPTTVEWMGERAAMLHDAGDLTAAEPAYIAANSYGETAFEAGDTRLAYTRQGLGNLYLQTRRPALAVPLYRLALASRETAFGADDPATLSSVDKLARALWQTESVVESEALFRRLLAAREASDGADSTGAADALRWIGRAASAQDRKAEAEIVFKRVLAISEARNGPDDVLTAFDLIALGQLYSGQQRFNEARPLLQRAVTVLEAIPEARDSASAARMALSFLEFASGDAPTAISLAETSLADTVALSGEDSRDAADIMLSIAGYQQESGAPDKAEPLILKARGIYRAVAPQSRAMLRTSSALGRIRETQGRFDEALTLHREVLAALVDRYGEGAADIQPALSNVGATLFEMGDYAGAADAFEQATAIVERLAAIDSETAFAARTGEVEDQAIARAAVFDFLIKSYSRLAESQPEQSAAYADKAFVLAQRVTESRAAGALAQMAARQAAGDGELAALVRERQDLVAEWRREDANLTKALASADPAQAEAQRARLTSADARIAAIDAMLATAFPAFAQLQKPAPPSLAEIRSRLGENDVLLFFADTNRLGDTGFETYLWVVPKSGEVRWLRLPRASGALAGGVRELREAMGVGANVRGPKAVAQTNGTDRVGRVLTAAHELHDALLGQVGDLIAGKSLVIVPSKSLSALPFHALVASEPPAASADRFREAHWLARDHAVTILPSVASLAAPAAQPTSAATRQAYMAFANPLLLGRSGSDRRAFERTGCAPAAETLVAAADDMPETSTLFRGADADVAALRLLPPLPETTDEVCAIATVLGATPDSLHLGAAATETALRELSADGDLARARVLHFATHGLVSGELSGLAEPAIVLTPPEAGDSTDDDGLLTASEVTTLKLDADWVILSACNTASSDGTGSEALSGLARAFFYAGARALMVSHWPVSSEAAVRLASGAVEALVEDPAIGKAEALRRAMVAEIDRGGAAADPASWAPFILVGAAR